MSKKPTKEDAPSDEVYYKMVNGERIQMTPEEVEEWKNREAPPPPYETGTD